MRKLLELGPHRGYGPSGPLFIGLATSELAASTQSAGQLLIGPECRSLEELEAQVAQLKTELDQILVEARARF